VQAEALAALAPIAGLAANVAMHVAVSHAVPSLGFLARAALGLLGGAGTTGAIGAIALAREPIGRLDAGMLWLLGMLTYLALGFGYFNFVNLNVTSLRVRLLRELLERHPDGLVRDDIIRRYGAQAVLRLRLERLVRSGQVVVRGDRLFIGRKGVLLIARIFTLLRRLVIPSRQSAKAARSHA
jgi:hypothetical protein